MIRIIMIGKRDGSDLGNIRSMLKSQADMEIVGSGVDGCDALRLVGTYKPDIALLEEGMDLLTPPEAVEMLKSRSPDTKVIILTNCGENEAVLRSISSGAAGYLIKQGDLSGILTKLRFVHHVGGLLMTPEIAALAYGMNRSLGGENHRALKISSGKRLDKPGNMSRQELRVVISLGQGLSNKEIAETLRLKNGTIRNYLTSILQKTGLENRTQVALYVRDAGLMGEEGPRSAK